MSVSEFFNKWKNGRKSHAGEKLEKLYLGKRLILRMRISAIFWAMMWMEEILLSQTMMLSIYLTDMEKTGKQRYVEVSRLRTI